MIPRPVRFLSEDWVATYESQLHLLWFQSMDLNASLYLLERITGFPFGVFAPDDELFWTLVADALYEKSVMAIWRIAVDSAKDSLTLSHFRDELVRHLKDEQAKLIVFERLKAAGFDKRMRTIRREVTDLRHQWLAHFNQEVVCGAREFRRGMPVIPLDRLKAVGEAATEMIGALNLDGGLAPTYLDYSGLLGYPLGTDSRSDIERILDDLAERNGALRMPESDPELWRGLWQELSEEDREEFNRYRLRFGLSDYPVSAE